MINIISRSILEKRMRGPKKVAENLMAGLEKLGYPYVVNKAFDATDRLWIHDDLVALQKISSLPERVKVLVGPNLFINPEDISASLDLSRTIYLQPSENVKKIWEKRGMKKAPMVVWPAGVDTELFTPSEVNKNYVLVYFKNRKEEELRRVLFALNSQNLPYKLVRYGGYKEEEYRDILNGARFVIWLGCPESQGLALLEALSTGLPAIVTDENRLEYGQILTAAPLFDERCGLKINNLNDLPQAIKKMVEDMKKFNPREFILENLTLEGQARHFINLFDIYFDLSFGAGFSEKLRKTEDWRNNQWWFKTYIRLKEMLK